MATILFVQTNVLQTCRIALTFQSSKLGFVSFFGGICWGTRPVFQSNGDVWSPYLTPDSFILSDYCCVWLFSPSALKWHSKPHKNSSPKRAAQDSGQRLCTSLQPPAPLSTAALSAVSAPLTGSVTLLAASSGSAEEVIKKVRVGRWWPRWMPLNDRRHIATGGGAYGLRRWDSTGYWVSVFSQNKIKVCISVAIKIVHVCNLHCLHIYRGHSQRCVAFFL